MRKTVFKTTILAIILVAVILGTTVNAGSVTAPETVKAGEEVTVSINVNTAIENADITMEYDASKLTYKGTNAGANMLVQVNADEAGKLIIAVAGGDNTTKTISVTFTSNKDFTGDAGVKVTSFEANTNETLANTQVTIKAEEIKTPDDDKKPGEDEKDPSKDPDKKPENPSKPSGDKVGTDGKPITKLPQTGTPVFIGVIALAVATLGAIVLVKRAR